MKTVPIIAVLVAFLAVGFHSYNTSATVGNYR